MGSFSKALPKTQYPYISAIWPSFVTISGPPRTLSLLKTSLNAKVIFHQVSGHSFGPYHAFLLHQSINIGDFIDSEFITGHASIKQRPQDRVLSIQGGNTYHADSIRELYSMVIIDILRTCQDFVSLLACHRDILPSGAQKCRVLSFGSFDSQAPIVLALQDHLTRDYAGSVGINMTGQILPLQTYGTKTTLLLSECQAGFPALKI